MYKKNVHIFYIVSTIICILTIIFIVINYKLNNIKKNLIIGYIYQYSWSMVKNYFISLINAGFKNIDVVMFIKDVPQETIEKIKSYGVIIYPMPDNPYLSKNCQRWELYANYLKENKGKYNMVLHTDVRDTIFQKDIFQFYNSKKSFFEVAEEENTLEQRTNKRWMLTLCDKTVYNEYFKNKPVICAGLAIGTPDKFIEYNNSIIKMAHGKIFGIRGDQRYLNYLVYHDNIFNDCITVKNNTNSHLMHIGVTKRKKIILDNNNNILNFNGEIASVVHQYERHKDLVKILDKKFNEDNLNYTAYKNMQQSKNILSKKEIIKFVFIIFIVVIIIVISIIYIIKKSKNYIFIKRNKLRKVKIINNIKNKRRKKFHAYKKIKIK